MQAYRVETTITRDGSLTIRHLPLTAGAVVEVIILVQEPMTTQAQAYPLRGTTITYQAPFEPVAHDAWDIQP